MSRYAAISGTQAIADPLNPQNTLQPNLVAAVAVTKSDVTVYSPPLLALYVGGTGNVAVRMFGSQTSVTLTGVPTGALLPICVDQVLSAGTSATAVIGFY